MRKRNKIITLLLATTMCTTVLSGCGKSAQEEKSSTNSETPSVSTESTVENSETNVTEEVVPEPLKNVDIYPLEGGKSLTVLTASSSFENGQTIISKAMEEATGVSVEYIKMTDDQYKLALSGQEIPDITFLFGKFDKATINEYGQADYFINFMDYLDIMPNFSALIEEYPNFLDAVQNEDGSVYCLPQFLTTATSANNLIYYRTDMMKEIGWENPPATTEEFLQYVKELQAHFGSIDNEFIAFNGYQPSHMGWDEKRLSNYFFSSFGELVLTELTVNSQNEVVLGAATEQYKYYLEFMNELWTSGAFNTNIYNQDATASQALAAGNHVAIFGAHNGHAMSNFASGTFDMDIMAPLTSEYWDTQHWYKEPSPSMGKLTAVSSKCEDIETAVKWLDAWYSSVDNPLNEEGTVYGITLWLGEVGVDYVFDDETKIYTEQEHEGIAMGKFASTQGFGTALFSGYEDGLFPYMQEPINGVGVKGKGTINNLWPYAETPFNLQNLILTQDEIDIYNDAWTDIDAFITEMTAKFITGELNIGENWEFYLNELKKMDLQDVLDAYQVAYDRYSAK